MTGTNCDLFTHKSSRSYLNHLILALTLKNPFAHRVFLFHLQRLFVLEIVSVCCELEHLLLHVCHKVFVLKC
jgi:hypothetical protein